MCRYGKIKMQILINILSEYGVKEKKKKVREGIID